MKQTLIHTKTNNAQVVNHLLLLQSQILVEVAGRLRNRIKMYAASPRAVAAMKREAEQAEADARELLRGAYGFR